MRSRVTLVLAITAVVLGGVLLVPTAYARLAGDDAARRRRRWSSVAAPAPTPPLPPTLAAGPVSVSFKGEFFSWALMDRETGKISGSPNMAATNSTESMIKAWIVSDYLRQLATRSRRSDEEAGQHSPSGTATTTRPTSTPLRVARTSAGERQPTR